MNHNSSVGPFVFPQYYQYIIKHAKRSIHEPDDTRNPGGLQPHLALKFPLTLIWVCHGYFKEISCSFSLSSEKGIKTKSGHKKSS